MIATSISHLRSYLKRPACYRLLLSLLLLLQGAGKLQAQAAPVIVLKGTILNRSTKLPIPYATVTLYPKEHTIQANGEGQFSIAVDPEINQSKLKVYALGYIAEAFEVPELAKQFAATETVQLQLRPSGVSLGEVEVKSRGRKRKVSQVGYNMGKGSPFEHELEPVDSTITAASAGQEIGNRIRFNKFPAALQKVSFGFMGSGGVPVALRIKVYALQGNMPDRNLLPDNVIVRVPPHFTGWVNVNLSRYNLTVQDDFVVVVEWLKGDNKVSNYSLMSFATVQKGQTTYYRESNQSPWKIQETTSIGMYATLVHE